MSATKVCCQSCGAPLEVDERVRFVTCNICQARLEVIHDPSVTHTRLLEGSGSPIDAGGGGGMESAMRVLQLQNQLGQLDRDWDRRRESLMVRGRYGRVYEPSAAGGVIMGIFAIVGGLSWMGITSHMPFPAPVPFPLFGVLFIAMGLFVMISQISKASAMREEKERYEAARRALEERIRAAGR